LKILAPWCDANVFRNHCKGVLVQNANAVQSCQQQEKRTETLHHKN